MVHRLTAIRSLYDSKQNRSLAVIALPAVMIAQQVQQANANVPRTANVPPTAIATVTVTAEPQQ